MRILIADDHGIMREGLRSLIEKQDDMEVVGEAKDGQMVVELARELSPDVIIVDITMPNLNGVDAARQILKENEDAKIIALSMHSNRLFVTKMIQTGVLGYVLKSYLFDELVKAIYAVSSKKYYLSPQITDVLVEDCIDKDPEVCESVSERLTDRDRHMLQLLSEGQSSKQIALCLGISPKTADAKRRQIMDKLGIYSVAELTKYAVREGLTSLEF